MFSEMRCALNGDLRVAYRASREAARDTVSVPNWFTNCGPFRSCRPFEVGDLVEGLAPWFHEVVHVAAREFDVCRARYVIGDVLALRGRSYYVVESEWRWLSIPVGRWGKTGGMPLSAIEAELASPISRW
jgi:hypothetical protein